MNTVDLSVGPKQLKFRNKASYEVSHDQQAKTVSGIHRILVGWFMSLHIFLIAFSCYRSLKITNQVLSKLEKFKISVFGRKSRRRFIRFHGKYYSGLYVPGFPSKAFNTFIRTELNAIRRHNRSINRFHVVHVAITNKCYLHCEHCFEWDNLNQKISLNDGDYISLVRKFQEAGSTQIHITGGEPMADMQRLRVVVSSMSYDSEIFILTSGFNVIPETARELKQLGVKGLIVSLDHFDPEFHNRFRGSQSAFKNAMNALAYARQEGLLTAVSICVTKEFLSKQNLYAYVHFAHQRGVAFVQLLEPKAVGYYEGKQVALSNSELALLEEFYIDINYNPQFSGFPVVIYHGYHQRRIGCQSGGNKIIYLDSAGYVDACPFCHSRNFHARDILTGAIKLQDLNPMGCPIDWSASNSGADQLKFSSSTKIKAS